MVSALAVIAGAALVWIVAAQIVLVTARRRRIPPQVWLFMVPLAIIGGPLFAAVYYFLLIPRYPPISSRGRRPASLRALKTTIDRQERRRP